MAGIGRRKDGWPNRDLDVWGPAKYDPRFQFGRVDTPLAIPPAYGLARVKHETYTAADYSFTARPTRAVWAVKE